MKQALSYTCIILLCLTTMACPSSVKKATEYQIDIADSIREVQELTMGLYNKGLIERDVKEIIRQVTKTASEVQLQGQNILDELNAAGVEDLTYQNKQDLLKYLQAISAAIDPEKIADIARIEDPDIRLEIQGGFETVRGLITTFSAMLLKEDN